MLYCLYIHPSGTSTVVLPIATNTCIPIHTVQVPSSEKARPSLVSTQHSLSVAAGTVPPVQLLSVKH